MQKYKKYAWMLAWFTACILGTLTLLLIFDADQKLLAALMFLFTGLCFYLAWRWSKFS